MVAEQEIKLEGFICPNFVCSGKLERSPRSLKCSECGSIVTDGAHWKRLAIELYENERLKALAENLNIPK